MQEELFKEFIDDFIDLVDTYSDRLIVCDHEYKILREKKRNTAPNSQEFDFAAAELDAYYRRQLCAASIKCFTHVLKLSGVI